MFKKKLMEFLWRLQASQSIISMIFWPLTLTGIFYPYLRERTNNFGMGQDAVLLGMSLLFFLTIGLVILIGVMFDKLRFWKEQNIVLVERNPYNTYKLCAKDIFNIRLWCMAVRAGGNLSEETKKELEFYETWIKRNLNDDSKLVEDVKNMRMFVHPSRNND